MTGDESSCEKAVVLELKVYMHCQACEKLVFKTLRKVKGVETVSVDMNKHKAIVTGHMKPEKILKKLKKKTGKRAEILKTKDGNVEGCKDEKDPLSGDCSMQIAQQIVVSSSDFIEDIVIDFDMFSDENPNACSVM